MDRVFPSRSEVPPSSASAVPRDLQPQDLPRTRPVPSHWARQRGGSGGDLHPRLPHIMAHKIFRSILISSDASNPPTGRSGPLRLGGLGVELGTLTRFLLHIPECTEKQRPTMRDTQTQNPHFGIGLRFCRCFPLLRTAGEFIERLVFQRLG